MDNAWYGRVLILAHWIQHFPGSFPHFLTSRHDLLANGAFGILAVDQIKKVRCYRQGQFLVRKQTSFFFFRGKLQIGLYLLQAGNAVLQLPNPIIPVLIGDMVPKALARPPIL